MGPSQAVVPCLRTGRVNVPAVLREMSCSDSTTGSTDRRVPGRSQARLCRRRAGVWVCRGWEQRAGVLVCRGSRKLGESRARVLTGG